MLYVVNTRFLNLKSSKQDSVFATTVFRDTVCLEASAVWSFHPNLGAEASLREAILHQKCIFNIVQMTIDPPPLSPLWDGFPKPIVSNGLKLFVIVGGSLISKSCLKMKDMKLKFALRSCHLSCSCSRLWKPQKLSSTKRKTTLIFNNSSLKLL